MKWILIYWFLSSYTEKVTTHKIGQYTEYSQCMENRKLMNSDLTRTL